MAYRGVDIFATMSRWKPLDDDKIVDNNFRPQNFGSHMKPDDVIDRVQLPALSNDNAQLFLGAIIERSFTDISNLHLTSFLIYNFHSKKSNNMNMKSLKCRIRNAFGMESYESPGILISHKSSQKVDFEILRCKIQLQDEHQLKEYIMKSETLFIEIVIEEDPIIHYAVPWRSRRTGFMLSSPTLNVRVFDAWQSLHNSGTIPTQDLLHILVPDTRNSVHKTSLAHYVEVKILSS